MCGVLALVFIGTTAAEIAILVKVGALLGGWATFGLVIATGVAGGWLARRQGIAVAQRLRRSLESGDPTLALVDAALVLAAGVMLLSPGFLTDATGLLLLLPPLRAPVARWLHAKLAARARAHVGAIHFEAPPRPGWGGDDDEDPPPPGVIDV